MSSRAASISAADSATQFCTICLSASRLPCTDLLTARSQSMSNARRHTPIQRMQWWMRPGPESLLGEREGLAALAEEVLARARARRV